MKIAVVLLAILIGLLSLISFVQAQTGECWPGRIPTYTQPPANTTISGTTPLVAYIATPGGLTQIDFYIRTGPLATLPHTINSITASSTSQFWSTNWNTNTYPNGEYFLAIRAWYGESVSCPSSFPGHRVIVQNGTASPQPVLSVELLPSLWEGPTNTSVEFEARTYIYYPNGTSAEVTTTSAYQWSTTIGSLSPTANRATFFSGGTVGDGQVTVVSTHYSLTDTDDSDIKVLSSSAVSQYPTSTGTNTFSSDTSFSGSDPISVAPYSEGGTVVFQAPQSMDIRLERCLRLAVGNQRFEEINSGVSRPTAEEYNRGITCFGQYRFNIPPNLAPVAADKVKNLSRHPNRIKIQRPVNSEVQTDDATKTVIILSGSADPNKNIFLYIFSEPLVLVTQTDAQGNWTYALENPLEPGSHEVYVVMEDRADEYITSDPILFAVARAQPTSQNPSGASLILEGPDALARRGFIVAAGLLIGFAALFSLYFLRRLKSRLALPPQPAA